MARHHRERLLSPYLKSVQKQVSEAVDTVLKEPTAHVSLAHTYQRLYKGVEILTRDKQQSSLSNELFQRLRLRTGELIEQFSATAATSDALATLRAFITLYDVVEAKLKSLQRIYLYLDRTYLLHHPTKKPVMEFGHLNLYGDLVERDVWQGVMDCFIGAMNELRVNYHQEKAVILQQFWIRFHKISRWGDVQTDILKATREFYHEAHLKIIEGHPQDLVFDVFYDAALKESEFWTGCDETTEFINDMKNATISELIFQNFSVDGVKFVSPLFEQKKYTSLMKLFQFIQHANGPSIYMNDFTAHWGTYIIQYVSEIIKSHTDDLVETLVKSRKVLSIIVEKYFQNNTDMEYKLREAFQLALRQTSGVQISKRFLRYIDTFFRNLDKNNDTENKEVIQDILLIFKSTTDKETFINVDYRRDLARRLLQQSTNDMDLELELLSLIEQEINPEIVRTLLSMFDDLKESDSLKRAFPNPSSVEFTPLILKKDNWPPNEMKATYPDELKGLLEEFSKFYISTNDKYEKRALKWTPNLGTMLVDAHFPLGDKELQVTTAQGLILLLLNETELLTFDEAKRGTKMDSKTVASALYSLSQGKYKVLKKEGDTYFMNESFKERRKNVKIRPIQVKIKDGQVVEEELDVVDSTTLASETSVEAFIVRHMKLVVRCSHSQLVEKCQEDMGLGIPLIKKCIEKMIELEYVARVDSETYRYVP